MSSSSSSSSHASQKPKLIRVDYEGNVYCNHDIIAATKVAGLHKSRPGEEFFCYSLWPVSESTIVFSFDNELNVPMHRNAIAISLLGNLIFNV